LFLLKKSDATLPAGPAPTTQTFVRNIVNNLFTCRAESDGWEDRTSLYHCPLNFQIINWG